ncbi:MAG: MTH938/NDUFAF3 family protein [Magnetospirillum sp. WYHS-4]
MRISAYDFGHITVDGQTFGEDVLIHAGRASDSAWHADKHRIVPKDLDGLWDRPPAVLVVGTGFYGGMMVPEATRQAAREHGVDIRMAPTREAVELFNVLSAAPSARVDAMFHVTC